ncbi:nose resistant to fluoxetine protein 6-like isoform X2 [Lycorma delicatula]
MKPRSILYLGMCVPSSCSYNDVQSSLNFTVNTTFNKYNLYGEIYLNESACFSEGDNKKSSGFYVMVSILLTMLILTITATMYDYFVVPSKHDMANSTVNKLYGNEQNYKTNKLEETFLAFSMKVNVKELVSDGVNSSIDVLNGGKFISLVFIMLGHRTLYSLGSALQNPEYWETSIISKWDMTFMNGTHLVDTFFLIGGFLAFFGVHGQLEKTKKFNLLLLVLFRWIRLMPVYAVVMGVYALLLIHLGSGPIWNIKLGLESENCRETWWLNTLFINNYIQPEKQCVLMSWYLACDMHFFIVSACIIYLLWKSPFYGEIVCGIIFIISLIIPFTITYMGNHDGKLKLYLKLLVNPYVDKEYNSVYIRSHSRSIPYLAGVIIGYISHRMKIAKCTIPKIFIYPGILLFVIAFGIQAYCLVLYIPGRPYSALENAIFSALLPLTWSIGIGWIILVSYTTGFGLFTWLFAQKIYTPLSRLAYCIVLIHPAVQLAQVSSNPTSEYLTYPKMVWMMLGDLTVSLLLSVILYLLVEAPFRTVSKLWLQNGWKRREPPKHSDLEQVPQQQMNGGNNVGLSQIAPGIPVTITNNINNSNYFNKDNIINGNS